MTSKTVSDLVKAHRIATIVAHFVRLLFLPQVLYPICVAVIGYGLGYGTEDVMFATFGAFVGSLQLPILRNILWERSVLSVVSAAITISYCAINIAMLSFTLVHSAYRSEFNYLFGPLVLGAFVSTIAFVFHWSRYRVILGAYRHMNQRYSAYVTRLTIVQALLQDPDQGIFICDTIPLLDEQGAEGVRIEKVRTLLLADIRDCFLEFAIREHSAGRVAFTAQDPDSDTFYDVYLIYLPARSVFRLWILKDQS